MKIACVQMTSGSNMDANIARTRELVGEASGEGAVLVGLPENVFLMEEPGTKRTLYDHASHPAIAAASEMAREHRCWLLVGSVAVTIDDSGKTVNRSLLLAPDGEMAAHYDKIHLFDVEVGDGQSYKESAKMLPGERAVIASVTGARLGMSICYDVRFPHLYRALAKGGADILAVPSAFTAVTGEAHWHTLLRSRAIENGCFVMAPAQTGTHPGKRKTYGHALIVGPWGDVIADAGTKEGVIVADLDLGKVAEVRARIPSLLHDRPFGFEDL